MTPKEKAKDLIEKMSVVHHVKMITKTLPVSMYDSQIKQCALNCVDEIRDELDYKGFYGLKSDKQWYWNVVKEEIIKYYESK